MTLRVLLVGSMLHSLAHGSVADGNDFEPRDIDILFVPRLTPDVREAYAPLLAALRALPDPFELHRQTATVDKVYRAVLDNYDGYRANMAVLVNKRRSMSQHIASIEKDAARSMYLRMHSLAGQCRALHAPPTAFCRIGYLSFLRSVHTGDPAIFARTCIVTRTSHAKTVLLWFAQAMAGCKRDTASLNVFMAYSLLCNLVFSSRVAGVRATLRRSSRKRCLVSADLGGYMSVELTGAMNQRMITRRSVKGTHVLGVVAFTGVHTREPRVKPIVDAGLWTPALFNDPITLERVRFIYRDAGTTESTPRNSDTRSLLAWEPETPGGHLRELSLRVHARTLDSSNLERGLTMTDQCKHTRLVHRVQELVELVLLNHQEQEHLDHQNTHQPLELLTAAATCPACLSVLESRLCSLQLPAV